VYETIYYYIQGNVITVYRLKQLEKGDGLAKKFSEGTVIELMLNLSRKLTNAALMPKNYEL
jgi:hypothetical protein